MSVAQRTLPSTFGVFIVRDFRYPHMYRVRYTDGTMSDMVNISRATDECLAERRREHIRAREKARAENEQATTVIPKAEASGRSRAQAERYESQCAQPRGRYR